MVYVSRLIEWVYEEYYRELRYYMGKSKVRVLERVSNKSFVEFLERGIVGNKKMGYRETEIGERLFVFTRCCWRNRIED